MKIITIAVPDEEMLAFDVFIQESNVIVLDEKKDLSEYTSGLDSTSNRKSSEDNIGADANTSIKDSSQNNNSDKDNGSSNDEKGGPGFFAP